MFGLKIKKQIYYLGEQSTEHNKISCIPQTLILLFNTTIKCGETHCVYQKCYKVLKKLRPKTLKRPAKFRSTEDNIKWYLCKYCKKTTALDPRQRTKTLLVCLLGHSPHAHSCWPGVENEILRKSLRYLFLSCAELASPSHFVRIQFFPLWGPL